MSELVPVAVVLPTYDRLPHLRSAIESVRRCGDGVATRFLVVDGGSTDGSREHVAAQPDCQLADGDLGGAVKNFNLGFALACMAVPQFPYVLQMNDDAELLDAGMVRRAVDALETDVGAAAVAWRFDLRGPFTHERVHGAAYVNFGVIRTADARLAARAQGDLSGLRWWDPAYRTYGADAQLGCVLHWLGKRVIASPDRVHDTCVQDGLRARNGGGDGRPQGVPHPDSELFWRRWGHPGSLEPGTAHGWMPRYLAPTPVGVTP